jgi:hypothetical protein
MTNLTDLLPAGAGGKQVSFTASGAISSGQTVGLKSDGTVGAITGKTGSSSVFESAGTNYHAAVFDSNSNKVVIAYQDEGNSNYGTAVVATVSGSTISYGTPVVFESASTSSTSIVFDSSNNKVVISYQDAGNGFYGTSAVGTVSGTSISFGTPVVFASVFISTPASTFDSNANKVVITYGYQSGSYSACVVGTVSGTSISFGTKVNLANYGLFQNIVFDSTNNKVIVLQRKQSDNLGEAYVGTVSGTSISYGTPVVYSTSTVVYVAAAFDSNSGKVVIAYDQGNTGTAVVGTVSGTSISFGSERVFTNVSVTINRNNGTFDSTNNVCLVIYKNDSTGYQEVVELSVSGTTTTQSGPFVVLTDTVRDQAKALAYDSNANKTVISYDDGSNSSYGTAVVYDTDGLSNADFIGITDAAISDTASGSVTIKGGIASNSDITTPPVNSAGSKVVFDDGGPTTGISSAYDPDTAKVVNVFCTTNVQGIVGTVSGTSISYGSASSANGNSSSAAQVAYDTVNNKIVAVYKEGFTDARVVIGTVSGTAISWGTPVVFASINAATPNVAFDTNAGKVLIVYKDQADNNYGKAVVGTVSGTSISIGSPVTFMNANANKIELVYDANAQKSVLVVQDASNNIGVAYVATISGTSVSFGSPTNFLASAVTNNALSIVYNSTDNKVIVGYGKSSDNKGYLTTGTVSGTSISFAGETEFSGSTTTNYISLAYKASGNILGMVYNIGGSTTIKFNSAVISGTSFSFGTEQELAAGATDTTAAVLDGASGNFVASYGDGSNNSDGTTNVASVSTSLVTNSTYYVQADGSLSTTTSSVLAGKALSSTSINLDYTT